MTRRYLPSLLLLAAVWGASYLFIKVAVRDLEPAAMIELRLLLAAPILVGFALIQRGRETGVRELRGAWREGLVLGALNAAIPFTLIAWGEKHVDSGVAAIANASVPLFVALLAIRFAAEPALDRPAARRRPARARRRRGPRRRRTRAAAGGRSPARWP